MLLKQKRIILSAIILAIISLLVIAYIFMNNMGRNTTKSGWEIYINKDANYQISYPKKWIEKAVYNHSDGNDDLKLMNIYNKEDFRLGFLPGEIEFTVGHSESVDKFNNYLKSPIGFIETTKVGGKQIKVENFKILDNPGVKLTYEDDYEGKTYGLIYYFKIDETVFSISFFAYDEETINSYQKEITEIINSFKLLSN